MVYRYQNCIVVWVIALCVFSLRVGAEGISVDAGLTPAEDRWIYRTQVRHMQRKNDPGAVNRSADTYAWVNVLAYGLRPGLTMMIRQNVKYREMSMMGTEQTRRGLDDFFVMTKVKLFRSNTRERTLGLAATLGLELPTGADAFTSDTWDLVPGLYGSWRRGRWASDLSLAYQWNGFADHNAQGINPGDELKADLALAYQIPVGPTGNLSVTPVMELSYRQASADRRAGTNVSHTGEWVTYVSPGLKVTYASLVLEGLVQLPVAQDQQGQQPEQGPRWLIGARFMF